MRSKSVPRLGRTVTIITPEHQPVVVDGHRHPSYFSAPCDLSKSATSAFPIATATSSGSPGPG